MTATLAETTGSSNPNPAHRERAGTGHFMLTLCELAAPVSIRPPQAPQLKSFTFFMSRARQPDGSERCYLHMGYFETLANADRWVDAVRRIYPNAFATIAPIELFRSSGSEAALPRAASQPGLPQAADPAPVKHESLTDTQVLKILEERRVSVILEEGDDSNCDQVALLRPDDTGTRQALKEAVVQGEPVSFAVQLQWSAQPIDLSRVPSHAVFKGYTLYAMESRRKGRSSHFLRVGFFADPISAKQVAVQVRSLFVSAAVVPVVEAEVIRAREATKGTSTIAYLAEQRVEQAIGSSGTPATPRRSEPRSAPRRVSRGAVTIDRRLEPVSEREIWNDPDPLSASGVRHLRVEVQEHLSGRWKRIRFDVTPTDTVRAHSWAD